VDRRACLREVEKRKFLTLPGLELRTLGRRQSLYRLRYSGTDGRSRVRFPMKSLEFSLYFIKFAHRITFKIEALDHNEIGIVYHEPISCTMSPSSEN
jgi:hypothetical protein